MVLLLISYELYEYSSKNTVMLVNFTAVFLSALDDMHNTVTVLTFLH